MNDVKITELRRIAAEHRDEADRIEREGIGLPRYLERDARCERENADAIAEAADTIERLLTARKTLGA